MRERWAAFLDRLLGPRCDLCRRRVFPDDQVMHDTIHHAGDPR